MRELLAARSGDSLEDGRILAAGTQHIFADVRSKLQINILKGAGCAEQITLSVRPGL